MAIITVSTQIKAPLSQVWRSWTLPQHIIHWNFASEDWHCPKAENDLREGGVFKYHMAAKDGSMAFDFSGSYSKILHNRNIDFHLDDMRKVKVTFEEVNGQVRVSEGFEAEGSQQDELQKQGWQAILNNFKKYTESLSEITRLHFDITINAPVEQVYEQMLDDKGYREWTAEFNPGSFYKGKWQTGEKMLFIGVDDEGNEGGMVSSIKACVPNKLVSIEHYGIVNHGKEITSGSEVEGWAGSLEEYRFEEKNGATLLKIALDTNKEFKSYFEETWPKALNKLKSICENN